MVVNKRKKNSRQRGSMTHGWGSKKKHRGAGHRGGRGRAGSGKRGDAKKPSLTWKKGKKALGKYGFTSRVEKSRAVNISTLEQNTPKDATGKDLIKINLTKERYDKLLGAGEATHKYEITVKSASKRAIEKIEKAGGKVVLPGAKKEEAEQE